MSIDSRERSRRLARFGVSSCAVAISINQTELQGDSKGRTSSTFPRFSAGPETCVSSIISQLLSQLRFRLKTVFILVLFVAIACRWSIHSLSWIALQHKTLDGRAVYASPFVHSYKNPRAPAGLWVFGERRFGELLYDSHAPGAEYKNVQRLFPEARILKEARVNWAVGCVERSETHRSASSQPSAERLRFPTTTDLLIQWGKS